MGIGEVWSAGSIPLRKDESGPHIFLVSIEPASVRGDVRLEGVAVRTGRTFLVALGPGVPTGLRPPRGYEVTTTCTSPSGPVGEVVITLTKVGPRDGEVEGFVVTYWADGRIHRFDLRFEMALCASERFEGCGG